MGIVGEDDLDAPDLCSARSMALPSQNSMLTRSAFHLLQTTRLRWRRLLAPRRQRLIDRCRRAMRGGSIGSTGSDERVAFSTAADCPETTGASIMSKTERPCWVMRHPPSSQSTRSWEKIAKLGTRAARRLVRSDQSFPLVARMAMSRFKSVRLAKPSG